MEPDSDHLLNLDFARLHLFKEPRVRRDIAIRKASNKNTCCSVVKTTLNKFCTALGTAIRTPLNDIIRNVNATVAEAYLLANVHVIRMIDGGHPLGELNHSFFYGCLSAVSQSTRKRQEIKDVHFRQSVALYKEWLKACPDHVVPVSDYLSSGLHQQASQQMATNTHNACSENFARRFKRYLKHKYNLDGPAAWSRLRSILASSYEGDDESVMHYRKMMPKRLPEGNIEDTPHIVMPLMHMILKYFEEQQDVAKRAETKPHKALRLFSLLPNKSGFECSHVKICTNGLYGLLKRSESELKEHDIHLPKAEAEWRTAAPAFWRRFFRVEKFETANRKFAGEIVTDGLAVSIVMRKPTREDDSLEKSQLRLDDFEDILGLDPGRTDLYTTCDLSGRHVHYPTRRFREAATYNASRKTIQGWMDREPLAQKVREGMPTRKTSHLDQLRKHVTFVAPYLMPMLDWHMRKPFRKLKLRRYIASKKTLRQICTDLTARAGRQTLIGFGDWSNKDSAGIIKKKPAGPVKKLEAELKKHCTVVSIDEFRTSKLHGACGCTMRHRYSHKHDRNGNRRLMRLHSVLYCPNSSCSGISMNRDENASRSILKLMLLEIMGLPRPFQYRRGSTLDEEGGTDREWIADGNPLLPLGAKAECLAFGSFLPFAEADSWLAGIL